MNDTNQPKDQGKRRDHLFSPHTDLCIYCGQSAQDDAIENTPCGSDRAEPCEARGGKVWLLADNDTHGLRIERCDACQIFESDLAASEAIETSASAQSQAVFGQIPTGPAHTLRTTRRERVLEKQNASPRTTSGSRIQNLRLRTLIKP